MNLALIVAAVYLYGYVLAFALVSRESGDDGLAAALAVASWVVVFIYGYGMSQRDVDDERERYGS